MINEKTYLKIEAYLNGSIAADDKDNFEKELKQNEELRKELALFKSIHLHFNEDKWESIKLKKNKENIREINDYFESSEASAIKEKLIKVQNNYNSKKKTSYLKYILPIAASFILAILLFKFSVNKRSFDELYSTYYNPKDLPSLVARGANDSLLDSGISAFKNKNHKKAIFYFNNYAEKKDSITPLIYIYIGFSNMQLGNYNDAIENFNKLQNSNTLDYPRALWYKSLVFLKVKDTIQLKNTLKLLSEDSSKYKNIEAKRILRAID